MDSFSYPLCRDRIYIPPYDLPFAMATVGSSAFVSANTATTDTFVARVLTPTIDHSVEVAYATGFRAFEMMGESE